MSLEVHGLLYITWIGGGLCGKLLVSLRLTQPNLRDSASCLRFLIILTQKRKFCQVSVSC